jgi:hypothetical protein
MKVTISKSYFDSNMETLFDQCGRYLDGNIEEVNEKIYDLCAKYLFSEITEREREILNHHFKN